MTALEQAIWQGLPRLLTLLDRAALSPTRGSADRAWWLYRSDKDYPSASFAQAAWPLAVLAGDERLLAGRLGAGLRARCADLALAALEWWAAIQHADGSCDEWFHNERSQVATAFTALGAAQAIRALGPRFEDSAGRGAVLRALERAGHWLAEHPDRAVANHSAGAVAALAAIGSRLPGFGLAAARRELDALLALQDAEGFFPEYGGADPGYGTVTLAFLARARIDLGEHAALDLALARLEAFLEPWVNPDGSFGGEQGRRATRYAWLSGFALRAPESAVAGRTLERLLAGLAGGTLAPPLVYDDRYFVFFAYPDAVAALAAPACAPPPSEPLPSVDFPRAGLFALARSPARLVFASRCGGAFKLHALRAPGTLLLDDCGYIGSLEDGRLCSSWSFAASAPAGALCSAGAFAEWRRDSPVARHPVAFRLFNRTLGAWPWASRAVAAGARRRFTHAPRALGSRLERELRLETGRLEVLDRLLPGPGEVFRQLRRGAGFAPIHVPSAPLWLAGFEPLLPAEGPELAGLLRPGEPLQVETRLELDGRRARLTVHAAGRLLQEAERELPDAPGTEVSG